LRLRRLKFVREQFFLAAVAQNIKRLASAVSQPTNNTYYGSCLLAEGERKHSMAAIIAAKSSFRSRTFSTPTCPITQNPHRECNGVSQQLLVNAISFAKEGV